MTVPDYLKTQRPRGRARRSKIRPIQRIELQPGDPVWVLLRHSPGEDQSIFSQRVDVERYIAEKGLVVTRWYIDEAKSGSSAAGRGAFEQMMFDSREQPPPVRAIIVWDLSRFSRDHLEAQFYTADLRLRGYQIVSIMDDIPEGELALVFEGLLMWKNAKYLRDLQAATNRGLDALVNDRQLVDGVERSGFSGGGFPPKGYVARTVQIGTKPSGKPMTRTFWELTPDPDLRARVSRAWEMAIEAARAGLRPPYLLMHRECRLHRDSTSYYDMVRMITYAGVRKVGDRYVEGAHEAYVSREDFDLVQGVLEEQRLGGSAFHYKRAASPLALSGRVFCGYCGAPVNLKPDNRRPGVAGLSCSRRSNDSHSCSFRKLSHSFFLDALTEVIQEELLTEERLLAVLEYAERSEGQVRAHLVEKQRHLTLRLANLQQSIDRLLDAIESGEGTSSLQSRLADREGEKREAEVDLAVIAKAIEAARPRRIPRECLSALLSGLKERLAQGDLRELLQAVVIRVDLWNEAGKVYFSPPPEREGQ